MAPHYDRHANVPTDSEGPPSSAAENVDDETVEDAAETLREVEVEAAQPEIEVPDVSSLEPGQLEAMNIDGLRAIARELDVPERATITEKDELIAEIRQRL